MFFIARIVAAMFTGSCGSYRTTRTAERTESSSGAEASLGRSAVRVIWPDVTCCPHLPRQHGWWRAALRRSNCVAAAVEQASLDDWSARDQSIHDHDHCDD